MTNLELNNFDEYLLVIFIINNLSVKLCRNTALFFRLLNNIALFLFNLALVLKQQGKFFISLFFTSYKISDEL